MAENEINKESLEGTTPRITDFLGMVLPEVQNELVMDCQNIADNFQKLDNEAMDTNDFKYIFVGRPKVLTPAPNTRVNAGSSLTIDMAPLVSQYGHYCTDYQLIRKNDNGEPSILWSKTVYQDVNDPESVNPELTHTVIDSLNLGASNNTSPIYLRVKFGGYRKLRYDEDTDHYILNYVPSQWSDLILIDYK